MTTTTLTKLARIRRSKHAWRELFSRFEQSGQTIEQFCTQQGLALSTLSRWRQRLRLKSREVPKASQQAVFVELSNDVPPATVAHSWDVEL